MKKIFNLSLLVLVILFTNCNANNPDNNQGNNKQDSNVQKVNIVHLTNESFRQKVFDYQVNKEWKYEGDKPAIIDFYADWCGPCRILSPTVEELAKEYSGKIIVYKVDTDVERELAQNVGIQSLPTLLFIPLKGQPKAAMGALPKETLVKAINEILLVK